MILIKRLDLDFILELPFSGCVVPKQTEGTQTKGVGTVYSTNRAGKQRPSREDFALLSSEDTQVLQRVTDPGILRTELLFVDFRWTDAQDQTQLSTHAARRRLDADYWHIAPTHQNGFRCDR